MEDFEIFCLTSITSILVVILFDEISLFDETKASYGHVTQEKKLFLARKV